MLNLSKVAPEPCDVVPGEVEDGMENHPPEVEEVGVSEQAEQHGEDNRDPEALDKPENEGRNRVLTPHVSCPIPLLSESHLLAHDGLLRKRSSTSNLTF